MDRAAGARVGVRAMDGEVDDVIGRRVGQALEHGLIDGLDRIRGERLLHGVGFRLGLLERGGAGEDARDDGDRRRQRAGPEAEPVAVAHR